MERSVALGIPSDSARIVTLLLSMRIFRVRE